MVAEQSRDVRRQSVSRRRLAGILRRAARQEASGKLVDSYGERKARAQCSKA